MVAPSLGTVQRRHAEWTARAKRPGWVIAKKTAGVQVKEKNSSRPTPRGAADETLIAVFDTTTGKVKGRVGNPRTEQIPRFRSWSVSSFAAAASPPRRTAHRDRPAHSRRPPNHGRKASHRLANARRYSNLGLKRLR